MTRHAHIGLKLYVKFMAEIPRVNYKGHVSILQYVTVE